MLRPGEDTSDLSAGPAVSVRINGRHEEECLVLIYRLQPASPDLVGGTQMKQCKYGREPIEETVKGAV